MRRIERLINLIAALLDADRPMTAEEIRERIAGYEGRDHEVFRRLFERDKEALRAMGIPLEVVPTDPFSEQADGYVISKARYYLPQLDLEPEEVAALHLAAEATVGSAEDASTGALKLAIDAPSAVSDPPRVVWGADVATEHPLLDKFYSAIIERTPVTFDYRPSSSEEIKTRSLEPYGLLHRVGHWYVVGRDRDRNAIRSFKLTRVCSEVGSAEGSYEIPSSFDVGDHLGTEAWEAGIDPPTVATVRFAAAARWWAEQNLPSASSKEAPDGALDVELPVSNLDALMSWALGFADSVEIMGPPEARARMIEHLRPFLEERS